MITYRYDIELNSNDFFIVEDEFWCYLKENYSALDLNMSEVIYYERIENKDKVKKICFDIKMGVIKTLFELQDVIKNREAEIQLSRSIYNERNDLY